MGEVDGLRDGVHQPGDAALPIDRVGLSFRFLRRREVRQDRKSTRLNSSHGYISYAVFCLKKKKKNNYHNVQHPTNVLSFFRLPLDKFHRLALFTDFYIHLTLHAACTEYLDARALQYHSSR